MADVKNSTEQYESKAGADHRLSHQLLKPAGCRSYLRRRLSDVFPEIVDGFVEEAKKGGCTHLKMATELLAPTRQRVSRKKSSVAKLLEELRGTKAPAPR